MAILPTEIGLPLRKDAPGFLEHRSAWVLASLPWLAEKLNLIHGIEQSERFWETLLTPYLWSFYNQSAAFEKQDWIKPIGFLPINGWSPPARVKLVRHFLLTAARSFRNPVRLPEIASHLERGKPIGFGIRIPETAHDLNCQTLRVDWVRHMGPPNRLARQRVNDLAATQENYIERNLIRCLPRFYVEHFAKFYHCANQIENHKIEKVFVEHYGSYIDRLIAGLLRANGAQIYQLQLGGYVGETRSSVVPIKLAGYEKHLTYGWTQGEKDEPFYAVRLEQFRKYYEEEKRRGLARHDVLVVYNQINSGETRDYYSRVTECLFKELDRDIYRKILLRPRGSTRWVSSKKSLGFLQLPRSVDVDEGKRSLASLCAHSRIVIHWNHPSTNFLECIFVGQPVMAVLPRDVELTALAERFYIKFYELGILHKRAEDLIRQLNSMDIDAWWKKVFGSPEMKEFCSLFARSRAEWIASRSA